MFNLSVFRLHPVAMGAALALLCAPALAQSSEEARASRDGKKSETQAALPEVVVDDSAQTQPAKVLLDTPSYTGSRLGLTARQTPAVVTVVDRASIEARGARTTQEMLQGVPGATASDSPGAIRSSYRGFTGASVNHLFNGINVQYSIAARPVDSWIYDRAEAIGGASSFLYGAGGVGGTVNYVTKTAERTPITEGRLRLGSHRLGEASVGLNRRIAGEGARHGDHHLRLDVNHRRAHSHVEGMQSRATQIATSLLSDLTPALSHLLAYEYQTEHVDRPYWGTPLLQPVGAVGRIDRSTRFKNYNSADGVYAQRVQWLRSVTEWQASSAFSLKNTFYAYNARRDYRNVEVYTFNNDNTAVIRSSGLLQRHVQRVVGNRIDGVWKSAIAGRASDWAFGLDISHNRQTRYPQYDDNYNSRVNPWHFQTERFFSIPGFSPTIVADDTNRVHTFALYAENRTALVHNLNLITALRHERLHLSLTNHGLVTPISPSDPAYISRSYHPTTGRIGVTWDASPGMTFYAQYATAADPPSGIIATASAGALRNNTRLTTGRQFEAGAKFSFWNGQGAATLAAYHITRKNLATQDPNNRRRSLLIGQQSSRGLEAAISLRPTPRWLLEGNIGHSRAKYDSFYINGVSMAGKRPNNSPDTIANLWTSYHITPALKASAGLRHVSKIYADAANTLHWPAYTLLDLGLSWQMRPGATLDFRVRNATDKVYATEMGSGKNMAYLGAPRAFDLTLHLSF
nr:TonB-dependent receptor [uncultured Ottowia sp.]